MCRLLHEKHAQNEAGSGAVSDAQSDSRRMRRSFDEWHVDRHEGLQCRRAQGHRERERLRRLMEVGRGEDCRRMMADATAGWDLLTHRLVVRAMLAHRLRLCGQVKTRRRSCEECDEAGGGDASRQRLQRLEMLRIGEGPHAVSINLARLRWHLRRAGEQRFLPLRFRSECEMEMQISLRDEVQH